MSGLRASVVPPPGHSETRFIGSSCGGLFSATLTGAGVTLSKNRPLDVVDSVCTNFYSHGYFTVSGQFKAARQTSEWKDWCREFSIDIASMQLLPVGSMSHYITASHHLRR